MGETFGFSLHQKKKNNKIKEEVKERRQKKGITMHKTRIGTFFLVSMLALAGIGASYAGLFDEINIHGEVSTAYVEFEIDKFSGTWVWKDPNVDPYEMIVYQGDAPPPYSEGNAWGYARGKESTDNNYDADVIFNNIFPLEDGYIPKNTWVSGGYGLWMADISFHYIGSIPIHIDDGIVIDWEDGFGDDGTLDFEEYIESYGGTVDVALWYRQTSVNPEATPEILTPCTQLHYCDHVDVVVTIDLPQNNDLQRLSATGSITIPSIQWNEYQCQGTQKDYDNYPTFSCVGISYQNPEVNSGVDSYWLCDTSETTPDPPVDGWNPPIDDTEGNYDILGWCVDQEHTVNPGTYCNTYYYSSLNYKSVDSTLWPQDAFLQGNIHDDTLTPEDEDPADPNTPLDADGDPMNWPCINYIINHKNDFGTIDAWDIQLAIWWYCDGVAWDQASASAGQEYLTAEAQNIVETTNSIVDISWWNSFPNNSENWYAILLDFPNSVEKQFIFIEVDP